jgi:hypothetical protein
MDGSRFDAWTRVLTRGISRRGTLKTLAGVTLAGVVSRTAALEADASTGTPCADVGDPCTPGQCCAGLACRAGFGHGGQQVCGGCLKEGAYCVPGECCSGSCTAKWWLFYASTCDSGGGGGKKAKCDGNGCNKKKGGRKKRGH